MILELLGYAPDRNPTIPGVLTNCSGVIPSLKGMKGAPSPAVTPLATLAATCQGAATLIGIDGATRFIAGSPTKLYEAQTSTWADVSRASAYTIGSTSRWRFAQQGAVSFAANGADTVQASVSSGAFSCIATAPVATIVETVGKFVFAANVSGAANKIQWSALNDYTTWTASIASQAGNDTLKSTPGPITAARRFGESIIVYKKGAMYLGTYVGAPNIWQFDQILGTAGAMSQEGVVNIGTPDNPIHLFIGQDDFYKYDGSKPIPIGENWVRDTVFTALLQSRYYACAALHDPKNKVVYFYYPVADSVNPDHCVVYNYRTGKWGVDDRTVEAVTDYASPGVTYEALGNSYSTYDALPSLPYDAAFQSSAQFQPGVFGTDHLIKTLTGVAGSTSFTTGDIGDDEVFSLVSRVRPRFITAPTSSTWTHSYRNNTGGSLSTDSAVSLSSFGTYDVLREARWHRGTCALTGDWELAIIEAQAEPGGGE